MNGSSVLVFLLASYGITFTATQADIFTAPRRWIKSKSEFLTKLLECAFCSGFWCSQIAYLTMYAPSDYSWRTHCICAFAGATFTYALDSAIIFFEKAKS